MAPSASARQALGWRLSLKPEGSKKLLDDLLGRVTHEGDPPLQTSSGLWGVLKLVRNTLESWDGAASDCGAHKNMLHGGHSTGFIYGCNK
ncbi:MAG TPA: hypothetical protein VKV79_02470 [Terriglobia bacterium]|nr:hypothetical protein [Terriglobia bacterium]